MYRLISQLAHIYAFLPAAADATPVNGVARHLMERAEAGAGRDPHEAQELRDAALAYLSVVR